MAGVLRPSKESPLIQHAIRKLNPEVFSHPVWIRFLHKNRSIPPEEIDNLYEQAQQLESERPRDACQLLLACAVRQNIARQDSAALEIIRHALELAKRANFTYGELWAHWGACAICFQQGNFDQAAQHLEQLETILSGENEWVLADFVNVIRRSLSQPEMDKASERTSFPKEAAGDPFFLAIQWLQNWGTGSQDQKIRWLPKWGYWQVTSYFHKWDIRRRNPVNGTRRLSAWPWKRDQRPPTQDESASATYAGNKETPEPSETVLNSMIKNSNAINTSSEGSLSALNDHGAVANIKSVSANDTNQPAINPSTYIAVAVHMLGAFDLVIGEKSVRIPASRGLLLLQYLLLHHRQHNSREVLMDIFWPDAEPETARNNLNVTIHSLRTSLRAVIFLPVIVFEDGAYGLASDLQVWLDVEEFEKYVKSGQQLEFQKQGTRAVMEYETAISLYQGDLLDDSPYESWTVLERERLRIIYLDTLARLSLIYFNQERYATCTTLCQLILVRDRCREDAHGRLMQCYSRLGQVPLALRQYQICAEALRTELEVDPAPETTRLYERIRRREQV